MFGIGVQELAIILVIALLVFGPKRMPELARLLGRGMGEFRKASHDLRQSLALDEIQNELRDAANTIHKPAKQPAPEPDRPAQAGDDLPSSAAVAPAAVATAESTGDPTAEPNEPPTPPEAAGPHPGELPLGNDDEHHPSSDEDDARDREDDQPAGQADSERG